MDINIVRQKRTTVRSQTTKLLKRIETKVGAGEADFDELEELILELDLKKEELNTLDLEIQAKSKVEEIENEILKSDEYNTSIALWKLRLTKEKKKLNVNSNVSTTVDDRENRISSINFEQMNINLPKLNIDKFNGDYEDFTRFMDQFEAAINSNTQLANIQKFNYLKSYLTGIAADAIKGFCLSNENYERALKTLKTRFGEKTILINTHLNKLLNLTPVKKSNDIQALRRLVDTCNIEIQNLEALELKSENYSSMLCPILMKHLPPDIVFEITKKLKTEKEFQIKEILELLNEDVASREKANALMQSDQIKEVSLPSTFKKNNDQFRMNKNRVATAHGLLNEDYEEKNNCVFCEGKKHSLEECREFRKINLTEKREFLKKKGRCFVCFARGHMAQMCNSRIKCKKCLRRHLDFMCPENEKTTRNYNDKKTTRNPNDEKTTRNQKNEIESTSMANKTNNHEVIMQTVTLNIINGNRKIPIRALFDSGSQKSYITKRIAEKIGYEKIGEQELSHSLFGGLQTKNKHKLYKIYLGNLENSYFCNFDAYDQENICTNVPQLQDGAWKKEIQKLGINISDLKNETSTQSKADNIDLLIGADVYGKLLTGKVKELICGVVAVETRLGWTIMGKLKNPDRIHDSTRSVLSLHVIEAQISDLWRLDTLGITDPSHKETREELERAAEEHFNNNIKITEEGRYEVSLPWVHGHPPLTDIRNIAERRLVKCVESLRKINKLEAYEEVFEDWVQEGIIQEIAPSEGFEKEHFLPHRAVIKENSSTAVRPVFDGSAREKGSPSINDCLEKGPNLVELIPSILNRFRIQKIGVVSDIRKAFLQIQLQEADRKFLKFIWWEHGDPDKVKYFQHNRVVFGLSCSPYLLGATIKYHLENAPEHLKETAEKLAQSFYVDNCVTSVKDNEELHKFITESTVLMSAGKFDLRGWEHNNLKAHNTDTEERKVPVLGLVWDLNEDTLAIDLRNNVNEEVGEILTKRKILSEVHKIFDPIGYTCPITLSPKILLQECWQAKVTWDTDLPPHIKKRFIKWKKQLVNLKNIVIPRCLVDNPDMHNEHSVHIFCDASKIAYATCIFLRSQNDDSVSCQLIQARSRVAPLKQITIPRLELLACVIGVRLFKSIRQDLQMENVPTFFWTDSANALFWIKRDENWAPFVKNRVQEIRLYSKPEDWNYVPGSINPADLPSRGCSVERLAESRWWEGPTWLKDPPENWPKIAIDPEFHVINAERKKTVVSAVNTSPPAIEFYEKSTSYVRMIRVTAWIYRFFNNVRKTQFCNNEPHLSVSEIRSAELKIFEYVQKVSFANETRSCFTSLHTVKDDNGIIRIKTKISLRKDLNNFRFPIVLPDNHNITHSLILHKHLELQHAGIQITMSTLREDYWIIRCRKTVQRVLKKCVKCRRFNCRPVEVISAPLPENRVRDALIFEVIGVDLCGPLILKDQTKSWVVLFTCAIFRAVHVELVTSLSTESFLLSLRRFISRRGRPAIVYSDNGTNLTRSSAELKSINFEKVMEYSTSKRITWKFNPPSAPWWGGFFERMIGMLKNILRKVLGKASLTYEELYTVLCDIESVINARPLTYLSEDQEDLMALTPAAFLQENRDSGVPDMDLIDANKMKKRYAYRQKIREDLRSRFRVEYLGQLKDFAKRKRNHKINKGDVVLVGDNNAKRINWPLGKVEEVFPGKDGKIRVVKVKTQTGSYLRPVQKLYQLELRDN